MADRFSRFTVPLEPAARAVMQGGHVVGLFVQQVRPKHVGEEMVIAIPTTAVIQRDKEQIRPLQRDESGPAVRLTGDRIAQWPAQTVEDRALQEKLSDTLGLALQDLLNEVVHDVPVVSRETGDKGAQVVASLHRQRCQLQRSDPALRALIQRCDILRHQNTSDSAVEVRRRLLGREAEVGRPDLGESADSPPPRQRKRRVGTAGDDHVHLRGQVLQQEDHPVMHLGRLDHVIVVEHQDHIVRNSEQVVDQRSEHRVDRSL